MIKQKEDIIERNKKLIERYPFLLPRNLWTDEIPKNYDYSYIRGENELPQGWWKLFLQMCEDIRQPLIDANCLDKFRFSQIKEKYNSMRCYNYGAPEEVRDIIRKYELMAYYVCTRCGKPAIYETQGYFASFCEDCLKVFKRQPKVELIEFKPYFKISGYKDGEDYEKIISFEDEWNRYLKGETI